MLNYSESYRPNFNEIKSIVASDAKPATTTPVPSSKKPNAAKDSTSKQLDKKLDTPKPVE